ncbi:hypothetical protein M9Y10_010115 [Tritrichomonas musculus]|uniref:Protein kinase domain-containing protein n=1 Tax=Tritrichomonas musculus TaxID=1915356 RepID=A0ABR2IQG9_9EUKA
MMDLKPGNVLFDENIHPHIIVFGPSTIFLDSSTMSQSCQILKGEQFSSKIDVYAYGILMYEVITNRVPYPELEEGLALFIFSKRIIEEDMRPILDTSDKIKEP